MKIIGQWLPNGQCQIPCFSPLGLGCRWLTWDWMGNGGGVSRVGGGYWWVVLRLFIAVIKVYVTAIFHNPC